MGKMKIVREIPFVTLTDVGEAPVGAITKETYAVSCSGRCGYSEHADTFDAALDIVKSMKKIEDRGTKITIVRVVDTVIRQFVVNR